MRILLTGGTGSFGKAFIKQILGSDFGVERLVVYSRDELKQWEMQQTYTQDKFPQIRFFLGDMRDHERLLLALERIDVVVHAAALKQVPAAEYNPMEFIKTNVIGADNLIKACLQSKVKNVIALSTDKAAAPINLYGASKLCSDKLFVAANNMVGFRDLRFSVVRYGNVMGSRGSVIPFFINKAKEGVLPITHQDMTRFNITLQEGVQMVIKTLEENKGGEIYVPKIPSYKVMDVAEAIGPSCKKNIIGIRPGEKIHEEMITEADSESTYDFGNKYVIMPADGSVEKKYIESGLELKKVVKGFKYNSGENPDFLTISEIRRLITNNVDDKFKPV
ncbi:UDP-N-acetylglucosamine 4,6-dehydratase (inverting) [Synechococcus sp. CC9616]|uniref:UDP-N-acetylglucosamine 4,6-dehydratase (inverting) n=1 Tax=Synechococcus sp. CC9616 TaxID=110663 RepID=UPI0004AE1166|nr:UDP-N-acetylglucosamine 4,6-dehydratase (inverting) [Synechococcus sp. CC9616]